MPSPEPVPAPDHGLSADADDHHGHADHDHPGEPQPFLVIMQRLGTDMAALMHGLWIEDYELMGQHAYAIAHHPPTDPADRQRFQEILGDEWEEFQEADHVVHEASEDLYEAVGERDLDAILQNLEAVQQGCVACHSSFRDRLLSEGSTVRARDR